MTLCTVLKMPKRKASQEVDKPNKKPAHAQATLFKYFKSGQQESPSTEAVKEKPKIARDPATYGIHIYTATEIESSPGNQREFRRFWNEKASELCSDSTVTCKLQDNRAAIEGAIYSSWTLHKTSLLQLQVEDIEARCLNVYKDEVVREYTLTTIRMNLERMLRAHASVNQLYSNISQSADATASESQITAELSELKKSQEALYKAIEKKEGDIQLAESEEGELMKANSPVELQDDELAALVKMVKNEQFQ